MPLTWKDRVKQTVSVGGTGALTLSTASSGYQALASGDNGLLFSYSIEDGTAWETGIGIYTHSGTSFARTTRYASSTGSALNVTTAAVVFIAINSTVANGMDLACQAIQPGGRLTLTSGTPVTTADVTGATTVYYTPYKHDIVVLWDGNRWQATQFTEASLALGTVTAFAPYDVFAYLSSGALAVEKLAWLNATVTMTIASPGVVSWTAHGMSNGNTVVFTTTGALPTGLAANTQYWVVNKATDTFQVSATQGGAAINTSGSQSGTHTAWQSGQRGTAVTLQDGRLCKSGDKTRLLLGTFFTTSTTTTEDSAGGVTLNVGGKRFLDNIYNQEPRNAMVIETTSSWNYTTLTWRQTRATAGNRVEFVCSQPKFIDCRVMAEAVNGSATNVASGVGIRSTTVNSAQITGTGVASAPVSHIPATYDGFLAVGYNDINQLEISTAIGTTTWYGSPNSLYQTGMRARANG